MLLKWLVLGAIVVGVWYGFKAISRRNKADEIARDEKEGISEMTACSVCGTYVADSQKDCGRAGCPFPA